MFHDGDLYIRPVVRDDLDFLRYLRSDPAVWSQLGTLVAPTEASQEAWLSSLKDSRKQYHIIASDKFVYPVGLARMDEIDHQNRSIRIGADIAKEFRGQGLGTQTYNLLLRYCFDFLNMHRVWLAVMNTNAIALGLYKKMGFREEGRQRDAIFRNGIYNDYILMSILEDEYRAEIQQEKDAKA